MKPKTELLILVAVGFGCTLTFLFTNIALHAMVRDVVDESEVILNINRLGKLEPINGDSEQRSGNVNWTDVDLKVVNGTVSKCLPNATGIKSQSEREMDLASQTLWILWTVNSLALLMAVPPWITVLKFVTELDPSWNGVIPLKVMLFFVLFHYPLVVLMAGVTWAAFYGPSLMGTPAYLLLFSVVSFTFAYLVTLAALKLTKDIAKAVGIQDSFQHSLGGETWERFWDNLLFSKVRKYFLQIYNDYEAGGRKPPRWKDM